MDVHSPEIRHKNMSHIRGKDTSPEIKVRKYLHSKGFRYRIHVKALPGKPDLVLKKYNTVIFINGCFWHGHSGCKYAHIPKSNEEYWSAKINSNIERDLCNIEKLQKIGWNVITIWTCQLKDKDFLGKLPELIKDQMVYKSIY